jgi:hypothetical protein
VASQVHQEKVVHAVETSQQKLTPVSSVQCKISFEFPKVASVGNREKRSPVIIESEAVYEGEWLNELRDGQGKQHWNDGSLYEGDWRLGKANGKGKRYYTDGDIYEGDWLEYKANGKGTYTHANGAKYVGNFKDDEQHGFGLETWPDGAIYEG